MLRIYEENVIESLDQDLTNKFNQVKNLKDKNTSETPNNNVELPRSELFNYHIV